MKKAYPFFIVIFLGLVLGNYFFAPKEVYLKHNCNLQSKGECALEKDRYKLVFSISPLPINPLHALEYQVSFWDKRSQKVINPESVNLRILGHDMTMQEELFFPLESKGTEDSEKYFAKRIFPTCTEELMTWRLFLNAKLKSGETIKTTFDLKVKRLKE